MYAGIHIYRIVDANSANKHTGNKAYLKRKNNPWNKAAVDSTNRLLRTGDLVVRRGDDMTSYMLSQLNTTDKTYSHCGMVVIENGQPFVYHSIGGEDNPNEKLRKDRAVFWFSPANNMAYAVFRYPYSDSALPGLVGVIDSFYRQQVMFDMDFDLKTDDRMYCSEMIYKALKNGIDNNIDLEPHTRFGRTYIGVDDLYRNEDTRLVCQIRFK